MKIGIMSEADYRKRTLAIAKGTYRPTPGEPKIWFTSLKSVAEVLNERNIELLRIIAREKPESVSELAVASGRAVSNLSRTLKTLARYGIVELEPKEKNRIKPIARYTRFLIAA
jgi:predicted transcriptional regulator